MSKWTKTGLMRKRKDDLLRIAAPIEFVNGEMLKGEIADAILIMDVADPDGLVVGDPVPGGPGPNDPVPDVLLGKAPDDPDYPKSIRIRRIEASQKE